MVSTKAFEVLSHSSSLCVGVMNKQVYKCPYCGKTFYKRKQMGGHTVHCKNFYLSKYGDLQMYNKANKDKHSARYKDVVIKCKKCGTEFETIYDTQKNIYQRLYCSPRCSHSRTQNEETKNRISTTLKNSSLCKDRKKKKLIERLLKIMRYTYENDNNKYCEVCHRIKPLKRYLNNRTTCSSTCTHILINRRSNRKKYKFKNIDGSWSDFAKSPVYKNYLIYKITNKINNKYYIGMHATNNINDGYLGSGVALKSAIKKYGKENFVKEILETFSCYKDLVNAEKRYITQFVVDDKKSYNMCRGGLGGFRTYTEKTRKKISESLLNYYRLKNEKNSQIDI